jgi:hypothetical protein
MHKVRIEPGQPCGWSRLGLSGAQSSVQITYNQYPENLSMAVAPAGWQKRKINIKILSK